MVQLSFPVNNPRVSSPYGPRTGPGSTFHHGIDFGWNTPVEPVFAAAPGTVRSVNYSRGAGNVISIRHGDGTATDYIHLLNRGVVTVGQQVTRRQHIGTMGNTGTQSFGRHLHFQYWVNGKLVDPAPYFSSTAGGGGTPIRRTEEETMHVIERTGGTPEWSLIWPALTGPSEIERGYIVTSDPTRAKWWQRFYARGSGSADKFGRDEYVEGQANARLDHEAWACGQTVVNSPVDLTATNALITEVNTNVAVVDVKVSQIPTSPASYNVSMTATPK